MADVITIAVEGCCHGDLDKIYDAILRAPGRKVDLLICCGDFQATRNAADLMTMSVVRARAMWGAGGSACGSCCDAPVHCSPQSTAR